ncbi:WD repeat-containing protein 43 [Phytophthora ramorum]|uniref:WD repeat-containing protein 43 n=1 Tax=Phytophthora ramorum TaxID=164328 RepID=UPI0030AEFE57|nr:WD repeat-containing protein 43 [Phytophthora ramorum]
MDEFVLTNIQIYALNVSSGHWTPSNSRSKLSLDSATTVLDGRLKLWNVATSALQQELKKLDHLSYRYTCLTWSQPASKSKKRDSDLGLLALGTSNGSIMMWDLATGEAKHTLQNETSHAVQALAFNPQDSLLYASSTDKHVLEWIVSSGQTQRKFRCWRPAARRCLSFGKKSRKLASGLSSAITELRFAAVEGELEASRFLFAATAGVRFVNIATFVWSHKYEQVSNVAELTVAFKPLPPTVAAEQSAGVLLAEISTQGDKKAELLVTRGSLLFEKVSLVEENAPSQWKRALEFAEISDALLLKAVRVTTSSECTCSKKCTTVFNSAILV